nr:MAG TPA: hypothetical protein [Caudoviricetes sp.]
MFIHDFYMKKAIEAIKNDLNDFNEDCLKEIAYNEKDFNNRIFVFSYSNDVNYLYIVNVHPEGSVDVENYYYEYGYSIENK